MGSPQVTPITENWHAGGFVVSEARGHLSRDQVTIASGAAHLAGEVLGKISIGTIGTVTAGSNTGNGTSSAATATATTQVGTYTFKAIAATVFEVIDPKGRQLPDLNTGVAYTQDLNVTITAGNTPFAAGDTFTCAVAAGSSKYGLYDPTLVNGQQIASAILLFPVDATTADRAASAIVRTAEVNESELVWGANVTTHTHVTNALAALASQQVIARPGTIPSGP